MGAGEHRAGAVSYEEFMQICEKSTLRMEYINGEIHLLGAPDLGHQEILGRLRGGTASFPTKLAICTDTRGEAHEDSRGLQVKIRFCEEICGMDRNGTCCRSF